MTDTQYALEALEEYDKKYDNNLTEGFVVSRENVANFLEKNYLFLV